MNEPKLRFKADDGSQFPDWEEKKLGDITSQYKVRNKKRLPLEIYSVNNIVGFIPQSEQFDDAGYLKDTDTSIYMIVPPKHFAYNPARLDIGSIGYQYLDHDVQVSSLYEVFETSNLVNDEFLWSWFHTHYFNNVVKRLQEGGVRLYFYYDKMQEVKIGLPSLPEQQKIAEFLSTIDTMIEKQKETVSAWEERKKGVMQKLFSQEVRFKADDGSDFLEWEEKSFSDVFENLNNSTFSRDCLNYEAGNVKYIHYGDILTKFGFAIDVQSSNVPYVNDDLDCEKYASLSDGDIVIADTAEDDTVGKAVEIMNTHCGKTISGLHTIACHPKEKFASKYLGYFMNAGIYHNQLRPYMQGIKVTSVSKTNIALTKILVPCLEEQQKIADCLSSLDEVIEKQKATLAAWEELKKGLLQQMFV
mgnify:CR=1 FL=1